MYIMKPSIAAPVSIISIESAQVTIASCISALRYS